MRLHHDYQPHIALSPVLTFSTAHALNMFYREQAGFINIHEQIYKLPIGEWPKKQRLRKAGACFREVSHGVKDMFATLVEVAGVMTQAEFLALHDEYRMEQFDKDIHITSPFVVVYGQKPESE